MRCGESQTHPLPCDVMRRVAFSRKQAKKGGGIALLTPYIGDEGVAKTRSRAGGAALLSTKDRKYSHVGIQLRGTYVGVGGALWAADAAVMP